MKLFIFLLSLGLVSCQQETTHPKERVYFHIYVRGNPFVASVTLDKPAQSDFFVTFNWFDTNEQTHLETLMLNAGASQAQHSTGVDSTGYMRGIEMIDWTKESQDYTYVLDRR